MRMKKKVIIAIMIILFVIFPFIALFKLIPASLCAADNLLTIIGLFIGYYTLLATVGIALFIYWLQNRNMAKEEKRRHKQAMSAMYLALENAFELFFFMPEDNRDSHYCDGIKDVLSINAGELREYLTSKEFDHLVKLVNSIHKRDCQEAYHYVRDWLQTVYLSDYQEYMVCAFDYMDLLDKKTFMLLSKLSGRNTEYIDLKKINSEWGDVLFERVEDRIRLTCSGKVYLDGVLGFNDIVDEPVVLSGFGIYKEYEGYFEDGFYHGKGILFNEKRQKLKEGIWEKGKLLNGIEYDMIFEVTGGKLIYKPDCPEDPYDSTEDFKFELYGQFGVDDIDALDFCRNYILQDGLDAFYIADLKVDQNTQQFTNIRTLRDFLKNISPEFLDELEDERNS